MPAKLKELLKGKLPEKELKRVISSFDVVGEIAIIKIPTQLIKKQKLIANSIFLLQPNVKTVVKITQEHSGKFRLPKYKFLAGKKTFQTISKENGCVFEVDIRKAYFSTRLSNERKRIYEQVKGGENVGVFFAGVGVFAIEIAKHSKAVKIVAMEWNPSAVNSMQKNCKLNKVHHVVSVKGNVATVSKKYFNSFDRVLMPSPSNSEKYLKQAVQCLKNGKGMVHFYHFASNRNPIEDAIKMIQKAAKKNSFEFEVIHSRIVNAISSQKVQVCIDAQIY